MKTNLKVFIERNFQNGVTTDGVGGEAESVFVKM